MNTNDNHHNNPMNCYILGDLHKYFPLAYDRFLEQIIDKYCLVDSTNWAIRPFGLVPYDYEGDISKRTLHIISLLQKSGWLRWSNDTIWRLIEDGWTIHNHLDSLYSILILGFDKYAHFSHSNIALPEHLLVSLGNDIFDFSRLQEMI